ncbi:MAG: MOSC N-terminal beta barrel domain-containing protein [Paraburkholderia sp.]|uniref:MOSC domain-containing protein n=1 Tax=Paraburkholderia sp. TaxID=1926495 RepID=UPI003C4F5D5A
MPSISGLYVYPIKSCAGIALTAARLLPTGLEYDRNWMVTDPAGRMLTQRSHGRLALVKVALGERELIVSAPGMAELRTPLAIGELEAAERVTATIWDDTVQAFDTGADTAAWFSAFLGEPARLLRFDPSVPRVADLRWTGEIQATAQFSDGFPLLVIGEASLEDLNARLNGKGAPSVPMNRFRPNLVLAGLDAYEEDYVERVTILPHVVVEEAVQLNLVKPCARCPIPTLDQATGAPNSDWPNEPLDTMGAYRGNARLGGALTFGQNAIVAAGEGALLSLGQAVEAELGFGD